MPDLSLPDVTLHYETCGEGPPLVLIPGMFSDSASWAPLVPHLTPHFSLILPDPRGAGRTRPTQAPVSLASLASDIAALLEALGHPRACVAGHSLGGLVALALAALVPDRVVALATLGSTPLPSARIPAQFDALCAVRAAEPESDLWLRALFPLLFHDGFFRDGAAVDAAMAASLAYPHAQGLRAMQHQAEALRRLDLDVLPQRLAMPTLALLAEEDALIAPGPAAQALNDMGAEPVLIQNAGHAMHWDRPEEVASHLLGFFQRFS